MSPQHHTFFDARMFSDAHLAAKNDILLDNDAAGEPGLGRDHDVFTDLAVVSDVHQVIDLGAPSDSCHFQCPPVDGRVGSNFNIVSDFETSYLGKLFIVSRRAVTNITEAICCQYRTSMNDHAIAEPSSRINSHVGINFAIASDRNTRADHHAGTNPGPIADLPPSRQ